MHTTASQSAALKSMVQCLLLKKHMYLTLGTYTHRLQILLILQLTVSSSHRNVACQQAAKPASAHVFFFLTTVPQSRGGTNSPISWCPRSLDLHLMYIFLCRHNRSYVYQSSLTNYLHQLQHSITAENATRITGMPESGEIEHCSDVGFITADTHNEVM